MYLQFICKDNIYVVLLTFNSFKASNPDTNYIFIHLIRRKNYISDLDDKTKNKCNNDLIKVITFSFNYPSPRLNYLDSALCPLGFLN